MKNENKQLESRKEETLLSALQSYKLGLIAPYIIQSVGGWDNFQRVGNIHLLHGSYDLTAYILKPYSAAAFVKNHKEIFDQILEEKVKFFGYESKAELLLKMNFNPSLATSDVCVSMAKGTTLAAYENNDTQALRTVMLDVFINVVEAYSSVFCDEEEAC